MRLESLKKKQIEKSKKRREESRRWERKKKEIEAKNSTLISLTHTHSLIRWFCDPQTLLSMRSYGQFMSLGDKNSFFFKSEVPGWSTLIHPMASET